jgi:hypothetical protein
MQQLLIGGWIVKVDPKELASVLDALIYRAE